MNSFILQIGLLSLVATSVFAWGKGGPGERAGSSAVAISWIASLATLALAPKPAHAVVLLLFDAALATALLVIAIRYTSLWLGVAMIVQAFVLALHSQHVGQDVIAGRTFVVLANIASYAQLLAIVASTCASWLKRSRARRNVASPPPPPGMLSAA